MSLIAGIDLGTTNSLIGLMDAGFPVLIADGGERLTPSVVHFPETGQPLVGRAANRLRITRPAETIFSVKRFMGRRVGEIDPASVPFSNGGEPGQPVEIAVHGFKHSPEEISAIILRKLKQDAERVMEQPVPRAVITVPAYFNDAQRQATKSAGEQAGFVVERIVNEPTAAALAYGLDKLSEKARIAVFDLGGGTFDISILELNKGVFHVLATHGNTRLGGDDIDEALMRLLLTRFEADGAADESDPLFISRLRESAIVAKHRLSEAAEAEVNIPFAGEDRSFSCVVTRADLDKITGPVIAPARERCLRALMDAGLAPADLDQVVLVGGATRMPIVRDLVADIFRREPNTSQNPDEAVALGATIQAGILEGKVRNMVLLDVTPLSLGIETFGGLMNVIIPRNSTIPLKAGEMFTNALPNQESMLIKVLQGEREMARDNWALGQFDLEFDPSPKGQARVGVQFEIDANGILNVLARDTKTGREKTVHIRSAVDVSDEAVEQMVAESVDHAFEDMNERILTEARLKGTEMLAAVSHALGVAGNNLDGLQRDAIQALADGVREAVMGADVRQLKKANEALDEGTQELATLLVDLAMEEALRRKGAVGEAP